MPEEDELERRRFRVEEIGFSSIVEMLLTVDELERRRFPLKELSELSSIVDVALERIPWMLLW